MKSEVILLNPREKSLNRLYKVCTMGQKRKGFMNERAIAFFPSLAIRTGSSDKALILQQFYYITLGKEEHGDKQFYYDDRWWFYGSYDEIRAKFFSWIKPGTFKRYIQDLETVGVIESRIYEPNKHKKWYTLASEDWTNAWFDRSLEDDQQLIAQARTSGSNRSGNNLDQIDPKAGKLPDQNDPDFRIKSIRISGSNRSGFNGPHLYIDSNIKDLTNITPANNQTSASEESNIATVDPPAPVKDAADWDLIQEDLDLHQVAEDAREEFRMLGAALTLAWLRRAEQAHTARNPIGVAIAEMRAGKSPPDDLLIEAREALDLRRMGDIKGQQEDFPTWEEIAAINARESEAA